MNINLSQIEIKTKQNIFLEGYYFENKHKKCIFFIPGMAGEFYKLDFAQKIAEISIKNKYDFLAGSTQGSGEIKELKIDENGKKGTIVKGAAYEKFEDCIYDIDAWLEFLKSKKYDEIIIICHSLGCNKIVHYLNKQANSLIKKLILLAPQDIKFNNLEMHAGLLEEAIKNINNNESNKLLSKKLLGFCLISSQTYYELINNQNIMNIPYKTNNPDFSKIADIKMPILSIIGTKDGGEKSEEYMALISKNCQEGKYHIIKEANHIFKSKEDELSKIIMDFLEG
ncbi:MAG: alpha/beta hydrolase [Bacilli bacterium]|nr:alpha/beta hydrolase [Bacilli bacterium]